MSRLPFLGLACAVVLGSGTARATDTYPDFIRNELGLASTPECTLCHLTNDGQENTVRRPFGLQVLSHNGTGGGSRGSIRSALSAMEADGSDSDGDGVSDIDELRAGSDPNVFEGVAGDGGTVEPAPAIELPPQFETGCAVTRSSRVTNSRMLVAIASLLGALRLSRRKRGT